MKRIEMPCSAVKCSKRWVAGINAFNALTVLVKKCDDASGSPVLDAGYIIQLESLLERLEKELS